MNLLEDEKILIFGYGNPGRHDDALGPLFAQRIQQMNRTTSIQMQITS